MHTTSSKKTMVNSRNSQLYDVYMERLLDRVGIVGLLDQGT